MKVTVCQIDSRASELDRYISDLAEHVKSNASELVLLPEMPFFEWLAADKTPSHSRWLEAVESHNSRIDNLKDIGARAVVGTRPIVKACGSRRNQAYIWYQDSLSAFGIHEKYYLPNEEGYWESSWYERGEKEFETTIFSNAIIATQICTEMWFFEWARHYASSGVDILCTPRATPHDSTEKWLAGGQAAAVCSGAYSLSSNLWCPHGSKADCGGLAWIIDPEGNVLATTDTEEPFKTVEIDLEFSKMSKHTYPRYVRE
ncbi:MAG: carbon-nitrogen hydrolase family protein [Pseudomonadota bacterium]